MDGYYAQTYEGTIIAIFSAKTLHFAPILLTLQKKRAGFRPFPVSNRGWRNGSAPFFLNGDSGSSPEPRPISILTVSDKVAILGCGNVGVSTAADLSLKGYNVILLKTSKTPSPTFDKIRDGGNIVRLREKGCLRKAVISEVSDDLSRVSEAGIIIVTIQSTYHENLIKAVSQYLNERQIVIVVCSYLSSLYFLRHCDSLPIIAETTGPYLEGRVETEDDKVVFKVGCRLSQSPLSVFQEEREDECMTAICGLNLGFANVYNPLESALLNPNMVLHTVGSVMSIPRIEFSEGNFCMYREAYSRKNEATVRIMLELDDEKKKVLKKLHCDPVDIFTAAGFSGDKVESFRRYAESEDRAISPTSIRSRYITEDVSQGLVLLESIAAMIGEDVPVASSLISLSGYALGIDFRKSGRTVQTLGCESFINDHYTGKSWIRKKT